MVEEAICCHVVHVSIMVVQRQTYVDGVDGGVGGGSFNNTLILKKYIAAKYMHTLAHTQGTQLLFMEQQRKSK